MRAVCYIVGILISLAVGIVPWLIAPVSFITVILSVMAAAMLVLCIIGMVKGWRCVFTAARAT